VHEIITYVYTKCPSVVWMVENPMTRIHKLNPWLGEVTQALNPTDVAGYYPEAPGRYNKMTWLFGNFNPIPHKQFVATQRSYPGWKGYGGKSIKTKNARSETPLCLAYGFYAANH
jgi:hypothetical protein